MDLELFFGAFLSDQPVGISVSAGEEDLKEQHGRGPQGGGASKPRQQGFGDQRLDLKKQQSRKKNAKRISEQEIVPGLR